MAVSMPSDVFIPQLVLGYARQAFTDSIEPLSKLAGPSPNAPIRLTNQDAFMAGQYVQGPTFKRIGSLVSRRDITSNSAATPLKLEATNNIGVKLHKKIGPVEFTYDAQRLAGLGADAIRGLFSQEVGRQAGEAMAYAVQGDVIAALSGIADGMAATAHTLTVWAASGTRVNLSPSLLNRGLSLLGDARDRFRRFAGVIARSESVEDLFGTALGAGFPGVADVAQGQGSLQTNTLGMPLAVVDDPTLTVADAGWDKYITMLVGPGALDVGFTLPMTIYEPFVDTSRETVTVRWRADFDFVLRASGATWDTANGGANPNTATLATGSNWDPTSSSNKEVPVVKLVHNYSNN